MAYRIEARWTNIPTVQIFYQLYRLPAIWRPAQIDIGRVTCYYLFGVNYAYPYSLPLLVVEDLAYWLNRSRGFMMSFDWQAKIKEMIDDPGRNEAADYGVVITDLPDMDTVFEVIGVYHLAPEENKGGHYVYIEFLDENNKRIKNAQITWTWQGRVEPGLPAPVIIDKPDNEINTLPFFGGVTINIWHPFGNGVIGLSANHPDERTAADELGNSYGHHSFMVVFRRAAKLPKPTPEPDPTPPPVGSAISLVGGLQVTFNQAAVTEMRPDADGNVTIMVEVRG